METLGVTKKPEEPVKKSESKLPSPVISSSMLKKIVEKHKQEKERAEKLLRAINKDGAS